MNVLRYLTWQMNYMNVFYSRVWSSLRWNSQRCLFSLHSMKRLLLLHCANFFSALSKLKSCQPTKELQAIKCRRMRIITSLLYSVESPVPRSCLPSTLSAPQPSVRKRSAMLTKRRITGLRCRKNVDDPDEQAL